MDVKEFLERHFRPYIKPLTFIDRDLTEKPLPYTYEFEFNQNYSDLKRDELIRKWLIESNICFITNKNVTFEQAFCDRRV